MRAWYMKRLPITTGDWLKATGRDILEEVYAGDICHDDPSRPFTPNQKGSFETAVMHFVHGYIAAEQYGMLYKKVREFLKTGPSNGVTEENLYDNFRVLKPFRDFLSKLSFRCADMNEARWGLMRARRHALHSGRYEEIMQGVKTNGDPETEDRLIKGYDAADPEIRQKGYKTLGIEQPGNEGDNAKQAEITKLAGGENLPHEGVDYVVRLMLYNRGALGDNFKKYKSYKLMKSREIEFYWEVMTHHLSEMFDESTSAEVSAEEFKRKAVHRLYEHEILIHLPSDTALELSTYDNDFVQKRTRLVFVRYFQMAKTAELHKLRNEQEGENALTPSMAVHAQFNQVRQDLWRELDSSQAIWAKDFTSEVHGFYQQFIVDPVRFGKFYVAWFSGVYYTVLAHRITNMGDRSLFCELRHAVFDKLIFINKPGNKNNPAHEDKREDPFGPWTGTDDDAVATSISNSIGEVNSAEKSPAASSSSLSSVSASAASFLEEETDENSSFLEMAGQAVAAASVAAAAAAPGSSTSTPGAELDHLRHFAFDADFPPPEHDLSATHRTLRWNAWSLPALHGLDLLPREYSLKTHKEVDTKRGVTVERSDDARVDYLDFTVRLFKLASMFGDPKRHGRSLEGHNIFEDVFTAVRNRLVGSKRGRQHALASDEPHDFLNHELKLYELKASEHEWAAWGYVQDLATYAECQVLKY